VDILFIADFHEGKSINILSANFTIHRAKTVNLYSGMLQSFALWKSALIINILFSRDNSRDRVAAVSSGFSDRHHRAVELPEGKAIEVFVVLPFLVAENTDGDGLAQSQRLDSIRTPVYASDVASGCNIGSQFV
jgi:hypothetical protein